MSTWNTYNIMLTSIIYKAKSERLPNIREVEGKVKYHKFVGFNEF